MHVEVWYNAQCMILCPSATACLMSEVWVPDKTIRKWLLPRRPVGETGEGSDVQEMMCGHFQKKYDAIQGMIMKIGGMDELLSG